MGALLCSRRAGEEDWNTRSIGKSEGDDSDDDSTKSEENTKVKNTSFKKNRDTSRKRGVVESEEDDSDDDGTMSEENAKVKNTNFKKNLRSRTVTGKFTVYVSASGGTRVQSRVRSHLGTQQDSEIGAVHRLLR